jgi:hypothetical protein
MAIQAAGSFGALGGDLSGINQFFDRQAAAARQQQALAAQAQQAQQAEASRMAIAQMQNATAQRGQDLQRDLGFGNLGVSQSRLGLDRELGQGQLDLGQAKLTQQGDQFNTSQANDLNKFMQSLGLNKDQFDKRFGLDQNRQEFEIEIAGKKFKLNQDEVAALIKYRNAQTADIPLARAESGRLADASIANTNSLIGDRTFRQGAVTQDQNFRNQQFGYNQVKDASTFLSNIANQIAPDDPQRAEIINRSLANIQRAIGGQTQGGVQIGPQTKFTDSPNPNAEQDRETAKIIQFFTLAGSLNNDEAKQALGKKMGIEQKILDSMTGAGGAGVTTPESGRAVAGNGFSEDEARMLNDLSDSEISDDGQRIAKAALERLQKISGEKGREEEKADLRKLISGLKDKQDLDLIRAKSFPIFGTSRTETSNADGYRDEDVAELTAIIDKYYKKGARFDKTFNFLGE